MSYIDDTILAGPDTKTLEEVIKSLGISEEETCHTFELRDEGEVGDFLCIKIAKTGSKKFTITQTGLITKILKKSNIESCNNAKTPAALTPLATDVDGDLFNESWDYTTVVGMLIYLSKNSRPDITYTVNQCDRFTHNPKGSHAIGVKIILRYLRGTKDEGMDLNPIGFYNVDCYVDTDLLDFGEWKTIKIPFVSNPELAFSLYSWVVLSCRFQNFKRKLL